jgi:Fe-S-cluster containining protein
LSFKYPRNIRFQCKRCAKCCGDTEERIRLILILPIEAKRISQKISKHVDVFAEEIRGHEPYVYQMRKTSEGKCFFLKNNSCVIYPLRPLICRFYPFQLKNIQNDMYEFAFTKECPGIGKGPLLRKEFFRKLFEESTKLLWKH